MSPLPLFDHADSYPQAPGHRDRDTSREAANSMRPDAARIREAVYRAIESSPAGLTADEAATALDLSVLTARPRVTELFNLGRIVATEHRRRNASGRSATVWRAF